MKILLIEDNPADARLIDIYLREAYGKNYTITQAEYLAVGKELLKSGRFDIVILDLTLPDSAGIDTFREVHALTEETPVIVLTGLEDESVGINTVKFGAQDFLIKGALNSKILSRSVNYSIERAKMLKTLSENARKLEEKTADLRREKQKLKQAQKLAHISNFEWNITTNIFTASDELYAQLGLDKKRLTLTLETFLSCVHPDDRDYVRRRLDEVVQQIKPLDFFHRIIKDDGEVRILHARGEILVDSQDNSKQLIGTEQDVTERKKEEQLEQLAMVATKSYNAVVIADKDGKIEWVNEGFTKLFGYKLEDVKGTYGEILRRGENTGLSPDSEYLQQVHRDKKPLVYENKNYTKGGKEYWVLTSLTPLLNERGEIDKIISIDSDITRQKNAEHELIIANKIAEESLEKVNKAYEELNRAKKQLEESLKVKEQFLANMSHEIRTPMNAIVGFTNLLLKSQLSRENSQYVKAIKTSGENLLVIINDILDFSKLESGKITFERIDFNIQQLISTLVELMLPKTMEKNIKLSSTIDKRIPEYLVGDPARLTQVLLNLVGNAIKFTNYGSVTIAAKLVNEAEENVEVEFAIRDTGIGIKEENLARIFESFTQASNDTTRKYGGTGLGLTISRQLVELMGGSIAVKSKVNEGSEFSFRVRLGKSLKSQDTNQAAAKEEDIACALEGVRILLVEDNFLNQVLAVKILDNWKCITDVASNGAIAVEKVERNEYDVILMDIQLPEMNGYEATTYIRTRLSSPKSGIPIIAMTAHAFADEAEKCMKLGMNDYISKPFNENKLRSKICNALLGRSQTEKENAEKPAQPSNKLTSLSYLEKIANGDTGFILKMIDVFMNQTPALLDAMKTHLDEKDWKSLKAAAHKIKPSVAFMGITELEEIIPRIEEYAANALFHDELPALLEKTRTIIFEALKELERERNKLKEKIV